MVEYNMREFLIEGERLFGKDRTKWRFACPNCGTIQTAKDFIALGAADKMSEAGKYWATHCIGRWHKIVSLTPSGYKITCDLLPPLSNSYSVGLPN